MIDVNKITSTLAKLPDAQLQQYAQMHKSDPYIMALAMTESNRRKELRAAGQGAQGMQEMPKVVDQAVAEMAPQQLPEDMGIARIPAGDMNFAGGGIVAFADGGGVERYQAGGFFETDPAKLRALAEQRLRIEQLRAGRLAPVGPYSTLPATATQASGSMLRSINPAGVAGYGFGLYHGDLNEGEAAELERRRAMGPTVDVQAPTSADPLVNRTMLNRAEQAARNDPSVYSATSKAEETGKAAPTVDTTRKGPGAAAPDAGGAGVSKGSASLEALYKKLQPSEAEYNALDAKETSVANALKNIGKSGIEEFEAEEAKRGDVFKGREARLAEQEKNLEGRKDQNIGLALLQAGAAMMSTPGGLGVALGKGVSVGTERYAAGLDKLNAAQERLMDAKDRLEELRVNRDDLTSRERRQLKNQAKQYEAEAEKLFLDGAHKKLGYKREDAKNMFAGITTLMGQETAAGATIQAAQIRSQDQKEYLAELRGGTMVETARKNIMADIIKGNPYADEPTRQRLFQAEWNKALQSNPALAKYAGVAPGGGGASSADPLGLR